MYSARSTIPYHYGRRQGILHWASVAATSPVRVCYVVTTDYGELKSMAPASYVHTKRREYTSTGTRDDTEE